MANYVTIAGRALELRPGDSPERMERVADYVRRTLAELDARNAARGRELDDQGCALELALRLADELFMAQDENSRLRRELLPMRRRAFELERANDALTRDVARLTVDAQVKAADGGDAPEVQAADGAAAPPAAEGDATAAPPADEAAAPRQSDG